MDERLQYEQLIGGKLESLPVPDMQDAIWARVKAQLDIDLPADDGDGGSSPQSPSGPGMIGWGLSVVIIALVTTFLLLKNKPQTKDNNNPPTITQQNDQPVQPSGGPPLPNKSSNKNPGSLTKQDPLPIEPQNDSATQQNSLSTVPGAQDTVQTHLPAPDLTFQPPADTTPLKKGKGMKDLKDEDYRIVPKKKN